MTDHKRSLHQMPQESPDWSNKDSLAEWINHVRAIAFLNGARHDEIDEAEAREWLRWHGDIAPMTPQDTTDRLAQIDDMMSAHVENWPAPKRLSTAISLIGKTLAASLAENARLRADCLKLGNSEIVTYCEGCGAWLLPDDDYVAGEDVSGCWAAVTDEPSKRERPCYAYRVGKPMASNG